MPLLRDRRVWEEHIGFVSVVVVALSAHTVAVLPAFLIGALANQIRDDLQFDEFALGMAVAIFWTSAAVGSSWLGTLAQRVGARSTLHLGVLVDAGALVLVAALARSWGVLMVCMALCGVANSFIQPGVSLLLARSVTEARRGRAFGISAAAVPLSTLIGGVAVPTVALTVGWRWVFFGAAVLACVSSALAKMIVPAGGSALVSRAAIEVPHRRLLKRAGNAPLRVLVLLGVAAALAAAATGSLGAFLVQGATHIGMAENTGGWLLAVGSLSTLCARLTLGVMADRYRGVVLSWAGIMLLGGAACIIALTSGQKTLYALATVGAFALGWGWPGVFNLAIVQIAPAVPAFATGVVLTGTYLGGVVGPPAFGALAQHLSYGWAWLCAGGCALAAGVVMLGGQWAVARPRS